NGAHSNKPPARSWMFQYRIGGKTRRLVIGQATAIKAGRAREIPGEHHAKVKLGRDPASEKRPNVDPAADRVGALGEKELAQQRRRMRPKSFRQVARHREGHAAPFPGLRVDAIDRKVVAARLNSIEQNSGAVTANRVRATMSAMFTWGMREGLV